MRSTFACTACGGTIAADLPVGGRVRCPICQAIVVVPEPPCVLSGTQTPPQSESSQADAARQFGGGAMARSAPPAQGSAIGALVCGIIGMLGAIPVGLIGLILGIVGTVRASRDPHTFGGRGMAISGIVLGSLSLVVWPILIMFLIGTYFEPISKSICEEQIASIHQAMLMYAFSSQGEFPDQEQGWQSKLVSTGYVFPDEFQCISDEVTSGCSYFYVPGYNMNAPPNQIVVYEHPAIHEGGGHVLYVDGTIEFVENAELMDMLSDLTLPDGTRWAPHERP